MEPTHFQSIAAALLSRRRLEIVHYKRQSDERLAREISPQRLVHYRDNWYLDSWCHLRRGLRTFSVDAIESALLTTKRAREVPEGRLDAVLGAGFGIFSGEQTQTAVLQFSPLRARWVSREIWHPDQRGDLQLDGSYILEVPYSDSRELIMDILKYGAEVEVLAPLALRRQVARALQSAAELYRGG